MHLENNETIPSDLTIFIAGGKGLKIIEESDLPLNEAGLIITHANTQLEVFPIGNSASHHRPLATKNLGCILQKFKARTHSTFTRHVNTHYHTHQKPIKGPYALGALYHFQFLQVIALPRQYRIPHKEFINFSSTTAPFIYRPND